MSPRPRSPITDAEILDATANVAAKRPGEWTLADITALTGLSPATIIQRFGSKHDLEIALFKYLNTRDELKHQQLAAATFTFNEENRHRVGLLTYRLLAALSPDPELSHLARGVA